jgi:predicted secreted protein
LKQGARRDLVDNINEVIGSHGGDRKSENIKSNIVTLDTSQQGATGVYNSNTSSRPTGTTRQHIKIDNISLDPNRS